MQVSEAVKSLETASLAMGGAAAGEQLSQHGVEGHNMFNPAYSGDGVPPERDQGGHNLFNPSNSHDGVPPVRLVPNA